MAARRKSTRKRKAAPKRKRAAKPLSASTKAALQRKAKKTRFTYGQLAKVYRRGQGAFLSSGSRAGVGMAAWAMGRVNSFIRGGHSQDNDIKRGAKKRKTRKKR